jgi:hypothetical protein
MSGISKNALIIFFLIIFFTFFFKAFITLDPDLGWRIASGQFYLNSGIPATDPFTYTMPSFPWVDHAWFVSFLIGLMYPFVGKIGLSILFSLLVIAALILSGLRRNKLLKLDVRFFNKLVLSKNVLSWVDIPLLLSFVIILPYSGVRAQVFTWILLSALLKTLLTEKYWTKYRFYLPIYFAIWSNIHGGVASGLMVLFVVLVAKTIKRRKVGVVDYSVFFGSFLATLINPYGMGFWREIWSSVSDPSLRWSVAEWMPAVVKMDFAFAYYTCLSLIFVIKYYKMFKLEDLLLYFLFFTQAILSSRHVPLWIIFSMPVTANAIYYFYLTVKENKDSLYRFEKVYRSAWILALVIFIIQIVTTLRVSVSLHEKVFYPGRAIEYLKASEPGGEIFSNYGWGGYLIWKYPEQRVFIDGRMPSWRWQVGIEGEESAAFDTYQGILTGDVDYQDVFKKYNIDTVLWPKNSSPGVYDSFQGKAENFLVFFGREKKEYDFIEELTKDGWKNVYEDSVSQILRVK